LRIRLVASVAALVAVAGAGILNPAPAGAKLTATAQPSHTTCAHLNGWLGTTRPGPNGQTFTPIYLRNVGSRSCTLSGVPRLTYNEEVGVAVRLGLSAARVAAAGRGATVRLAAHRGTANVLLWYLPTRYWPKQRCQPTRALSVRVEFGPKNVGVLVRTTFQVCSKFASTSITGVASTMTGL